MTDAVGAAVDLHTLRGLLKQSLDFELSFGCASYCGSQVEDCLPNWRQPLDAGAYKHERGASKYAVNKEEIAETVGVVGVNFPPLHNSAHSRLLPGYGNHAVLGKLCTGNPCHQRDKAAPPVLYGSRRSSFFRELTHFGRFSPVGCAYVHDAMRKVS